MYETSQAQITAWETCQLLALSDSPENTIEICLFFHMVFNINTLFVCFFRGIIKDGGSVTFQYDNKGDDKSPVCRAYLSLIFY